MDKVHPTLSTGFWVLSNWLKTYTREHKFKLKLLINSKKKRWKDEALPLKLARYRLVNTSKPTNHCSSALSSFLWFHFHRIILARLDQHLGLSTPVIGCFSVRLWKALWLLENVTWEPNGSLVANVATLKWFSSLTMATIFESNWKHEQKFRKQPQSSETPLKCLVCSTNSLFILTIRIIVH